MKLIQMTLHTETILDAALLLCCMALVVWCWVLHRRAKKTLHDADVCLRRAVTEHCAAERIERNAWTARMN